ncbi:Na(+)/H(+) antiporter subunit C [Gordonia terrae]|uniref:Na(+)/H(+) antiporter subunit C n=2 Tax=Gordonia terrae TaxID=2055 RepID=A0AAD0K733_9ACTN|nr:Na(+)/H(+) antiporter subunit C [Gordonia terrae]VTR09331.1 Multiple resistance and pH homeostasis protein C [Clostridioides difficile]ANY21985.1 Na(+)/H(+) antiporter subunit C [Gordonia terrae]AWO82725.1 Na(+)/H(+) antiporter subunit C [Gordonia terrae]VTS25098.1 Multiple resistance and pH homeostasis protein C [Gordonia terrae]GAB45943.1 Na(+)/H(+) antiporter subunit C [Gordonia terrae NBRC 100016]
MTTNLPLMLVVGAMAACGVYLLMERSLVRMLFGLLLVGNALNLMIIVVSGGMGNPPIMGRSSENRASDADPLAQGMVLTAIVIMMGVAAFVLALVYRLFVINRDDDDVEDDEEDVKILSGSLGTAPDRDRSDDPLTHSDTPTGDYFDDKGNPLTPEQAAARQAALYETDIMPTDSDVVDEIGGAEEEPDPETTEQSAAREAGPDVYGPGELGPDEVGQKAATAPPDGSGEDDADPAVIDQHEMPDRDVVGPDKKKHADEDGGDR